MVLKVKVERVAFPREGEEGDWYIICTNVGTIKGKMRWRPKPGEQLAVRGDYKEYRGQKEFGFTEAWHDLPVESRDLLRYACELTRGLGPVMEELIWEAKGEKWPEVKEGDVPRFKGELLDRFKDTLVLLTSEREKSDAVSWLMGTGATRNMSEAAWDEWKEEVVGVVQNDPYRLADLPHYSFRDVDDSIRKFFQIGDSDPRRIRAAVSYFMRQLTEQGPTVVPWWSLKEKIIHATGLAPAPIAEIVAAMLANGELVGFTSTQQIALAKHFEYEQQIWFFANRGAA